MPPEILFAVLALVPMGALLWYVLAPRLRSRRARRERAALYPHW